MIDIWEVKGVQKQFFKYLITNVYWIDELLVSRVNR